MKHGEVIEVDSDGKTDDNEEGNLTSAEMINLCQQLEKASLTSSAECALDVAMMLHRFRGQLLKMGIEAAQQTKLTSFWAQERSRDCHQQKRSQMTREADQSNATTGCDGMQGTSLVTILGTVMFLGTNDNNTFGVG